MNMFRGSKFAILVAIMMLLLCILESGGDRAPRFDRKSKNRDKSKATTQGSMTTTQSSKGQKIPNTPKPEEMCGSGPGEKCVMDSMSRCPMNHAKVGKHCNDHYFDGNICCKAQET